MISDSLPEAEGDGFRCPVRADESQAVVLIAAAGDLPWKDCPDLLDRTAVAEGAGLIHAPVEFCIHIAVAVELAAQALAAVSSFHRKSMSRYLKSTTREPQYISPL